MSEDVTGPSHPAHLTKRPPRRHRRSDAQPQVSGYSNSLYQGFRTRTEAERFMASEYDVVPPKSTSTRRREERSPVDHDDLAERIERFRLSSSEGGNWEGDRSSSGRTSPTPSTPTRSNNDDHGPRHHHHRRQRTASTVHPQMTGTSYTTTRSPPRPPPSSRDQPSQSSGSSRLNNLAEDYLRTHNYPRGQIKRIRQVVQGIGSVYHPNNKQEVVEALMYHGMERDRAGWFFDFVTDNGRNRVSGSM